MKKLPILLSLLFLANAVYAAPQAIPHEFHGKWQSADKALTLTISAKGLWRNSNQPRTC